MATKGIRTAYVKVGNQTRELDHSYLGVQKADIKGIQGTLVNVSGNDVIQYSFQNPAKPTVALTINDAGVDLIGELTGMKKDQNGYVINSDSQLPEVGLVVVAPALSVDKDVAYIFPSCRVTYSTASLTTMSDSKVTPTYDVLTFNANYNSKIKGLGVITSAAAGSTDYLSNYGFDTPAENTGENADSSAAGTTTGGSGAQG